jgi:hypothetical protein
MASVRPAALHSSTIDAEALVGASLFVLRVERVALVLDLRLRGRAA